MLRTTLLCAALALAHADDSESAVDCAKMTVKKLRVWLADRGLRCDGCAEKSDYVALCNQNLDAPLLPKKEPEAPPEKEKSIEDILAGLKGMPGMENIKMFTADDFKGMNHEQMAESMAGGGGGGRKRRNYRQELIDFYEKYGLQDKMDGVDAALEKWKGKENKMFKALYKKYDAEIRAKADASDDSKEEL